MLLVADVIHDPGMPAVTRDDEVTLGRGQPAAKLGMLRKSALVFAHS